MKDPVKRMKLQAIDWKHKYTYHNPEKKTCDQNM